MDGLNRLLKKKAKRGLLTKDDNVSSRIEKEGFNRGRQWDFLSTTTVGVEDNILTKTLPLKTNRTF